MTGGLLRAFIVLAIVCVDVTPRASTQRAAPSAALPPSQLEVEQSTVGLRIATGT
jgi:hypothetical protein